MNNNTFVGVDCYSPMNQVKFLFLFLLLNTSGTFGADPILQISKEKNRFDIKPYLLEWNGDFLENKIFPFDQSEDGEFVELGINNANSGKRRYKLTVDIQEKISPLILMLEGANYYSVLSLWMQDEQGEWVLRTCPFDKPLNERALDYGALSLPVDIAKIGRSELYIDLETQFWSLQELILFTQDGLEKYRNRCVTVLLVIGTLIIVILIASVLIGIVYKSKLSLAFSAYAVTTFLAVVMELGILTELIASDEPAMIYFISRPIYAIFSLSYALYAYYLFLEVRTTKALRIGFKTMIVASLLFLILSFLPNHFDLLQNIIPYVLQYIGFVVFAWGLYLNRYNLKAIQLFVIGSFMVLFSLLVSDLHLRNVIFWPNSTYIFFGSFIVEIILVGIGTFMIVRNKNTELIHVKSKNDLLHENIADLTTKVNQSINAYEVLANHRSNNDINAPSSYFDDPLSKRELEVVILLSRNMTNAEISKELNVSRNTVKTHLKKIYSKLEVKDRNMAVQKANEYGLI